MSANYSDDRKRHRPSSEVEAQLEQVRALVGTEPSAEYGSGAWFQARADANHVKGLEQELEDSISAELANADLTLALDGAPVNGHRVRADFLGTMLTKAQGLVNALAAALERPGVRNTTPDAKEENYLFIGPSFASSYGIRFSMLKAEELGHIRVSNEQEVLKAFTTLIDPGSSNEQVDALLNKHPRVRTNYRDMVDAIASHGAKVVARTHTLRNGVRMNAEQAYTRAQRLKAETGEALVLAPMKGLLVGGDETTSHFHFRAGKKDYHGKVVDSAMKAFKRLCFGPLVTVHLKQVPKVAQDGAQAGRTEYELLKVTKVRAPRKKG
ncbi:MAG: hypothetical protein JST66_12585 [Bacteroidetes bacterium]|nr:hypothetical protein [Bacteroidota bacterium]